MCGIAGLFRLNSNSEKNWVAPERIRHRGPDGAGYVQFDLEGVAKQGSGLQVPVPRGSSLTLVHTRLSIIDLATGSQPLHFKDKDWIVFNGELYNYRELRQELESLGVGPFQTTSDTEVVLAALSHWGVKALEKFNGMFAFAWWSTSNEKLILARDPMGIKPLYYSADKDCVEFSSEQKALQTVGSRIDEKALDVYLALGYLPAPFALRQGVRKLKPGHWVKFSRDTQRREILIGDQTPFTYRASYSDISLSDQIGQAVVRQMVSDVPIGVFLSGGLDSTIVATQMSRASSQLQSFSVGFEHGVENENLRAESVAKKLGLKHHSFNLSKSDCLGVVEAAFAALDEPTTSSSFIPLYLLARETRKHVKVVLSGQGADELFGGYTRYRAALLWQRTRVVPQVIKDLLVMPLEYMHSPKLRQLGALLRASNAGEAASAIYRRETDKELPFGCLPLVSSGRSLPSQLMAWDRTHLLSEDLLLYGDRMTMAHGLEMRVPFLDLELVAAVERLPERELVSLFGAKKALLRKAIPQGMPQDPLEQKKLGFVTPVNEWLDGPLKEWVYEVPKSLGIESVLPRRRIDQWYEARRKSGSPLYERELWSVMCLKSVL